MSSSVPAPLEWDRSVRSAALDDLRAIRRHNRVVRVDRFDAFYKAYVSGISAIIIVYVTAGWFGDQAVTGSALSRVRDLTPSYLGLMVAFALVIGIRSGGRGGPMAFEAADVRHVMLAPVAREDVVRSVAWRAMRHSIFIGATVGAILGIIATRRFPGATWEWVIGGGLFVGSVAVGAYGIALIFSGLRAPRWVSDVVAVAFFAWSAIDVLMQTKTSPFAWVSSAAILPLGIDWWAIAGVAVMFALGAAGLWLIPGWSLEAAERRSRLVGQLRFAATMQDVRTVMIIQRQLSQERLRVRPFIRLPRLRKSFDKQGQPLLRVFVRRSLHTMFRWSAFRLLRLVGLALLAGFAVLGAFLGTTPLIVVAGLALWLTALDVLEPLAQESDHPDRMAGSSRIPGWVMLRLMIVPAVLQMVLVLIAAAPILLLGGQTAIDLGPLLLPTAVLATLLPLGGAAIAVVRQPTMGGGSPTITPEIAGMIMLWRLAAPPMIAVAGLVPLGIARHDYQIHGQLDRALATMTMSWYLVFGIGAWAIIWIRVGGEMKEKLTSATAVAADQNAAKATANKGKK